MPDPKAYGLAYKGVDFNPTRRGAFKARPAKKWYFQHFFCPIKPKKINFSCKPMRMTIIAFEMV